MNAEQIAPAPEPRQIVGFIETLEDVACWLEELLNADILPDFPVGERTETLHEEGERALGVLLRMRTERGDDS